jgi:hypothetical protein
MFYVTFAAAAFDFYHHRNPTDKMENVFFIRYRVEMRVSQHAKGLLVFPLSLSLSQINEWCGCE